MQVGRVAPRAPFWIFQTKQRATRLIIPGLAWRMVSGMMQTMDLPVRKRLPHTIPQWISDGSWFFITVKCVPPGENQLCRADIGEKVLGAFKYNHEKLAWHCRIALLMPDHLHAIIAFPRDPGMSTALKNWKRFAATQFGVKWQRDFFDHRLRNDQELREKTSYIVMNPVRRGLCERAEDWIWIYRPANRLPPILSG